MEITLQQIFDLCKSWQKKEVLIGSPYIDWDDGQMFDVEERCMIDTGEHTNKYFPDADSYKVYEIRAQNDVVQILVKRNMWH